MDVGPAHRLIPWCSALSAQIRGKPATNQPLRQGYIVTVSTFPVESGHLVLLISYFEIVLQSRDVAWEAGLSNWEN
jgi:hypothetical protein